MQRKEEFHIANVIAAFSFPNTLSGIDNYIKNQSRGFYLLGEMSSWISRVLSSLQSDVLIRICILSFCILQPLNIGIRFLSSVNLLIQTFSLKGSISTANIRIIF